MIYITGDTHAYIDINKIRYLRLKDTDYLIILGDFGIPFLDEDRVKGSRTYAQYMGLCRLIENIGGTVLFIDGNHDNHNFWDSQPVKEWHGGRVHKHPDIKNCYHLMRGELFKIDKYKFLAFGGASSIDKEYRIENQTWWAREDASMEEFEIAVQHLADNDNEVDYIITHTMPTSLIRQHFNNSYPDKTGDYLEMFYSGCITYKKWYCGHFHCDRKMGYNLMCLYNTVEKIE